MTTPVPTSAMELRPEELSRTTGGSVAPLAPPDPIICYWPVQRPDLRIAAPRSPCTRGSPRR